jgi:hypothetical protein
MSSQWWPASFLPEPVARALAGLLRRAGPAMCGRLVRIFVIDLVAEFSFGG